MKKVGEHTDSEVKELLGIIEPRVTNKLYCGLSDKEMLKVAEKELRRTNEIHPG